MYYTSGTLALENRSGLRSPDDDISPTPVPADPPCLWARPVQEVAEVARRQTPDQRRAVSENKCSGHVPAEFPGRRYTVAQRM